MKIEAKNLDSGILLLYKPRKLSSNTAVNIVKKTLNVKKAGHLGTLDVEAEGLLPVTINSATKLFDYFLDKVKVYTTKIKFGEYSATYDLEGEITKVEGVVEREKLERIIQNYTGKILQTPPEYSAKKINGKRAYKLAEQGIKVELKPKIVEIFSIKILKQIDLNFFELEITCSAGTYIRALARDIAKDLSTSAVCYDIIRTKCGDFDINNSYTIEDIKNGNYKLVGTDSVFDLPSITISNECEQKLLNGAVIRIDLTDGDYKLFNKKFIGLATVKNSLLKIKIRLF